MAVETIATDRPAGYDEAVGDGDEGPRGLYAALLDDLEGCDLEALRSEVGRRLAAREVACGHDRPFVVDSVPRLVTAGEWEPLEASLVQRVRALNAFLVDVYGERRIVAAGVIPPDVVDSAALHEPVLASLPLPGAPAAVAGLDVVRDAEGEWLVGRLSAPFTGGSEAFRDSDPTQVVG